MGRVKNRRGATSPAERKTHMDELNRIWKEHTGKDLTTEEAWGMVEFVKMVLENADKNLDEATR